MNAATMSIELSVQGVRRRWRKDIQFFGAPEVVTGALVDLMHFCDHTQGVSWARCLAAAQVQHQKEVREAADATPLPE